MAHGGPWTVRPRDDPGWEADPGDFCWRSHGTPWEVAEFPGPVRDQKPPPAPQLVLLATAKSLLPAKSLWRPLLTKLYIAPAGKIHSQISARVALIKVAKEGGRIALELRGHTSWSAHG